MRTATRLVPVFAMLAAACSQSPSGDSGGSSGAPANGGSGGTGSGGKAATGGTGGGSGSGSGAMSGAGPGVGGGSGSAGSGATSGAGPSVGGGSGSGAGRGTGGTPAGAGMGGSGAMSGDSAGGSAGSAAAGTGGQGEAGMGPVGCPALPTAAVAASNVIQFNDNGGWCWYQDERALVNTTAGKFVIGSVASGGSRDSDQEVVIYDIAAGTKVKTTLESDLNPDDHNAPAFFLRPDGGYAALWATHRDTCLSYFSTYDGTSWAAHKTYDWTKDGCPWDESSNPNPPHKVTYANPWYLSAENKAYAGVRSVSTSPALLASSDAGSSWDFYGRLTATPTTGYVAGYFKYWGNGVDRIDFLGTEAHPRDNNNSLWHGYYKGGKLYNSKDAVIDDMAGDMTAQNVNAFTQIFKTGTAIKSGVNLCRMWNHDIMRYSDGTIVITGQGRADTCDSTPSDSDPDKRIMYARWDGSTWKSTYLVKAGPKLYADEQDYTGLSAIHPDNPNVVFVSSNYDPRDDTTKSSKKEIYMGVTCDNGATFTWAPITSGSTVDNIRPIVPKWDSSHTLLLWMKGTYTSAQSYSMQIVGTTAISTAPAP